jgi:hypothetical protein
MPEAASGNDFALLCIALHCACMHADSSQLGQTIGQHTNILKMSATLEPKIFNNIPCMTRPIRREVVRDLGEVVDRQKRC